MKLAIAITIATLICALGAFAQEKPRIYISDSNSWEMGGGFGTVDGTGGGGAGGGARPQTVEIIKTFSQRCPGVIITNNKSKADYIVLLDHEGGKNSIQRDNKIAVFRKDGDMVFTNSTRSLGNAVKDACQVIAGK